MSLVYFACAQPADAAVAELPTAGLATASVAVGVLGIAGGITGAHGGGWINRIFVGVGGLGLTVVDPVGGTFYGGTLVIDYPANLLAVDSIGWFGNFAIDPSVPAPPETAEEQTGFYDSDGVVYDLNQAPNAAMQVTTSNSPGVLTVNFVSDAGIPATSPTDFNFLGVTFTNISGETLDWALSGPGDPPNFYLNNAASSFQCTPNPSYLSPVRCGGDTAPIFYDITVPESPTWALMLAGFAGLGFLGVRRNGKAASALA